jgi:4-amino-4-deoxy-L-arabinose transferase-like glycosyltransferase
MRQDVGGDFDLIVQRAKLKLHPPMNSRAQNLLIVLLLWAAIYLPALGSLPIKGEEGRRILPAITMLETGNYLVPEVGGNAYFSKPPLINWLIAESFKIFGQRNEWTARLPSALCVLIVAIAFVTVAHASLGGLGSTIAAVIWLTSAGIIEKGRLAEIEALYVSLSALAIIFWLSFWKQSKSEWLVWIPASIFLGLGWLAKGPLHLVFFYAVVLAILWKTKNWRPLFHPAHFVGIVIMLGIFATWALPFAHATGGSVAAMKWTSQFSGRLTGSDFHFSSWILNIPRGLVYFLPWTILLPLVRPTIFNDAQDRQVARALVWGAVVPFLVINLLPGALPRYSMPALIPVCWLLAATLAQPTFALPRWLGGKPFSLKDRQRTVATIAILASVVISVYAIAIVPRLQKRENVKQLAAQIDEAVPPNESIYAVDPSYQPIFFYVRSRLIYGKEVEEIPTSAVYLLVRPERDHGVLQSDRWVPRQPRAVLKLTDYRKESILLLKIE